MNLFRLQLLLLAAAFAFAETPPRFEVATIKPAPRDAQGNSVLREGPDRIVFRNMTLRALIYYAYGNGLSTALKVSGGPDWMNRDRYDVQGLAQGHPTDRQFRAMLRTLLEDRFALRTHMETQPIDVYALVLARRDGRLGPKVQQWDGTCRGQKPQNDDDDPTTPRCAAFFRPPGLYLEGVTMFAVAEMLSLPQPAVGRIVEDRTALKGRYKMELEFEFAPPGPGASTPEGPSIFTAVQEQWGLRLAPAKGSLKVLVVDLALQPVGN